MASKQKPVIENLRYLKEQHIKGRLQVFKSECPYPDKLTKTKAHPDSPILAITNTIVLLYEEPSPVKRGP